MCACLLGQRDIARSAAAEMIGCDGTLGGGFGGVCWGAWEQSERILVFRMHHSIAIDRHMGAASTGARPLFNLVSGQYPAHLKDRGGVRG